MRPELLRRAACCALAVFVLPCVHTHVLKTCRNSLVVRNPPAWSCCNVLVSSRPQRGSALVTGCDLRTHGQPLPSFCPQVFGVLVATTGLASFALVLALVEQVVLEVIEDNVKRGSKVYQRGHVRFPILPDPHSVSLNHCSCTIPAQHDGYPSQTSPRRRTETAFRRELSLEATIAFPTSLCAVQYLILAWSENRKDIEVIWKQLSQVRALLYGASEHRAHNQITSTAGPMHNRCAICSASCSAARHAASRTTRFQQWGRSGEPAKTSCVRMTAKPSFGVG